MRARAWAWEKSPRVLGRLAQTRALCSCVGQCGHLRKAYGPKVSEIRASVALMEEHLICNQDGAGSTPVAGSNLEVEDEEDG